MLQSSQLTASIGVLHVQYHRLDTIKFMCIHNQLPLLHSFPALLSSVLGTQTDISNQYHDEISNEDISNEDFPNKDIPKF
jgi:hypothetical protein